MPEHLLGRLLALLALLVLSPVLLLAAIAIKASSRGPVLYRAERVGRDGVTFTMLKLRTMHEAASGDRARITGARDVRVFVAGTLMRACKLDEVPQLVNVVRGEMAVVGPRPEDPTIVAQHYTPLMVETLAIAPGLSSPGTLAYYAEEHTMPADPGAAEQVYLADLLPRKIARDLVYVRNQSWRYDAEVVVRTLAAIAGKHRVFRRRQAWERDEAQGLLEQLRAERSR
jgi:lipopolysaccharide/colanic/teichoic acid biosynthesis glycosyltransferase